MLTENDVVAAACLKLQSLGFLIIQSLHTSDKGVDIIAKQGDLICMSKPKGKLVQQVQQSDLGNHLTIIKLNRMYLEQP